MLAIWRAALPALTIALACMSVPANAGTFTVVHDFHGIDGANPISSLLALGHKLYGATYVGGASNYGTIFSLDTATGKLKTLHAFTGLPDGAGPAAALIESGGLLYGTTVYGGAAGHGTVFAFDPKSGSVTVIYNFTGGADGGAPSAPLLSHNGVLYGTATQGGLNNCGGYNGCGTVFAVNPSTGVETTLHSFANGADGGIPAAPVIFQHGLLYGTTLYGGQGDCVIGCGTIFSLDPVTNAEAILHAFSSDQPTPEGALIYAGGLLFGTTAASYPSGGGSVFSIDPSTGAEKIIYAFAGNGTHLPASPAAGLIYQSGLLYGTTKSGGAGNNHHGYGTLYSVDPATGAASILFDFGPAAGIGPAARLIFTNGGFYGTASNGGKASGQGTVFSFTP